MRGRRFTEEQIIAVLKEAEAGAKTRELCRHHGVGEQTFYRWKARYGGPEVSELRRLRQLEDENGHAATDDDTLLKDLFPILEDIVGWHRRGTRYGIAEDPADGLLRAGEPGVQLTWMDAKIGDWVVTPRTGKAVEINALWYNALHAMAGFARRVGQPVDPWEALATRVREGFARFWNATAGYCYDVIDGPTGHDDALRPNQIFAVSLAESPLAPERQRQVVDACARHLLTSFGLRSLAPGHPLYHGGYCGGPKERDAVYHQGPAWAWLLGPFALAHLRVYGDPAAARTFLEPLAHHLDDYGVGSIAEIFEGGSPLPPARVHRPGVERLGDAAGVAGDRGRTRPDAGAPTADRQGRRAAAPARTLRAARAPWGHRPGLRGVELSVQA